MFDDDPYSKKSPLGVGEHFAMLLFFLVVVCVGLLMAKTFIIDRIINEQTAPVQKQEQHQK